MRLFSIEEIFMPIKSIDNSKCIGCGTCIPACPMDVIRMDEKTKKAKIVYPEDCQICHMCSIYCPVDAITITNDKPERPMVGWG
jgi:Fe-S-cluster-containing hydrogenase component 2